MGISCFSLELKQTETHLLQTLNLLKEYHTLLVLNLKTTVRISAEEELYVKRNCNLTW